jgi:hypothetical protein
LGGAAVASGSGAGKLLAQPASKAATAVAVQVMRIKELSSVAPRWRQRQFASVFWVDTAHTLAVPGVPTRCPG